MLERHTMVAAALAVAACAMQPPSSAGAQQADRPGDTAVVDGAAGAADTVPVHVLDPLVVEGRLDDLTGIAVTASQGVVGREDIRIRPMAREGELLETVPGLIVTQHSGDGKSNQMFVRGFNLDHGTDFATTVEGMPVNLPSHAHGQGYTDLHFLVPELVERVEYRLGPYYAEIGDFGSAGGAHLSLRRRLDRPLALVEAGELGQRRIVAAASPRLGAGRLLAGGEWRQYDGPWEVPQDLRKGSGIARYSWEGDRNALSFLALGYEGEWRGSDQIPRRAVETGVLGRFAQVDSTLGGSSSRYSLSARWTRRGAGGAWSADVYGVSYDLDLHSNFTYFLDDPSAGDQIEQEDEGRTTWGGSLSYRRPTGRHLLTLGLQTRFDRMDLALRRTSARDPIEAVREDAVTQWSGGVHTALESRWTPRIRTVLGLRGDRYRFEVDSDRPANTGTDAAGILTPKASIVYSPGDLTELYLSAGRGFHSNDARGVVQTVDPASGDPSAPVDPLVPSRGAEIGLRTSPTSAWRSTLTVWAVELESELLFSGDAGSTEPSDAGRRLGLTWANFYQVMPGLTADLDLSLARARFHELSAGEDRIPGALENVVTAGLTWERGDGPYAALRLRRFGEHPLVEDGSVRADPTALVGLNLGWSRGPLRVELNVLNLFDSEAADVQYFYRSRLRGEPAAGVPDVHFHPVEPRRARLRVTWGG